MPLALALLLATPQSMAMPMQTAPCTGGPTALPAGMGGWAQAQPAKAAARGEAAPALTLGTGITATLLPMSKITFAIRPEKPGDSTSNGGIFAFVVPTAGRYRIALGAAAWIDVLRGITPATSVAHGHGPACSTVRKMVDFDLQPGRYLLQVAGSDAASLRLMVSRLS